MVAKLEITAEAEDDLNEAYTWYEAQRIGLGEDFASVFAACMSSVTRSPNMHQRVHENYRRVLLRRFPYAVYYEHANNAVTVYAVTHTARHSRTWQRRLR